MAAFHKCNDPNINIEQFENYVRLARSVFKQLNITSDDEKKEKLLTWGGEDMKRLFFNTGKVVDEDTFDESIQKIKTGLMTKINTIQLMYKLFCDMPQNEQLFYDWIMQVISQARVCRFDAYTAERAARDAIVLQTTDQKLRKIALSEGCDLLQLVELGCALEIEARESLSDNTESSDIVESIEVDEEELNFHSNQSELL